MVSLKMPEEFIDMYEPEAGSATAGGNFGWGEWRTEIVEGVSCQARYMFEIKSFNDGGFTTTLHGNIYRQVKLRDGSPGASVVFQEGFTVKKTDVTSIVKATAAAVAIIGTGLVIGLSND